LPITSDRTVPWPMKLPTLTDVPFAATCASHGASGSGDDPSGPSITVVTPCRA
jgi:hypothetical protein